MALTLPYKSIFYPSLVVDVMARHVERYGFTSVFSSNLSWRSGIENIRSAYSRDKNSPTTPKFPIFMYSRSILSHSSIHGRRKFPIMGEVTEDGLAQAMIYTNGQFDVNWVALFNNISDLEEFEAVYLAYGFIDNLTNITVDLVGNKDLSKLSEEERSFPISCEWQAPSLLEIIPDEGSKYYAFGGQATINSPVILTSDNNYSVVKEIIVSFYDIAISEENKRYSYKISRDLESGNTITEILNIGDNDVKKD